MNIVFDIGNVLIAWDPYAAFRPVMKSDAEIDAFFDRADFFNWNACQDAGRGRKEAIAAAPSGLEDILDGYFERFDLTITRKIPGSWAILANLRQQGHRVFGLTNWSADLWPIASQRHPEISEVFAGVVVSGFEGYMKPQRELYDLLCARYAVEPSDCLIIDDSLKNVTGAKNAGWQGHHFFNAETLRADLKERALL